MDKPSWYVVHVVANNENRVANELREKFQKKHIDHLLHEVVVPKRLSQGVRRGVKVDVEDRVVPGYVFVRMECTLDGLYIIRNHPRVIGILGADQRGVPVPLGDEEVQHLLQRVAESDRLVSMGAHFEIGEHVRVCDGLFASMEGVVEEIDPVRSRLKVSVSIFGRSTPVDLEFSQVEKL